MPEHLLARSTDFDRTKMTALLVLAGIYPPPTVQKWDEDLNWMPIPYDFEKGEHDYVSLSMLFLIPFLKRAFFEDHYYSKHF